MPRSWTAAALSPDPADIAPLLGVPLPMAGVGGGEAPAAGCYRNPVFAGHAPDPTVGRDPATGTFYIYVTHNYTGPGPEPYGGAYLRTPVLETVDFCDVVPRGDAMPTRPAWVPDEGHAECLWAPHIEPPNARGSQWLLYFSGFDACSGGHGIGVAVADGPLGPFEPDPQPLVVGAGYAVIDPFVFTADDGTSWLYWGSGHAPITARQLTDDGRGLTGEQYEVLHPADRYDGHMRLVEAFELTRRGGIFVARFSGENTHNARYAVMEEHATSMFGPFEARSEHPILRGNSHFQGPGHHDSFRDDADGEYLLYHAFVGDDRRHRVLLLDRAELHPGGYGGVNQRQGPSWDERPAPVVHRLS